jgi:hypothetical protein
MGRGRRGGAGAIVGALAGVLVLVTGCLTGCSFLSPEPGPTVAPECTPADNGTGALPSDAVSDLDLYGFWSPTWADPPSAAALQHPAAVPPGFDSRRKVYLTTIMVAPGTSGWVRIVKPQDARLYVAPDWAALSSLTALELQLGATRSVHLVGCEGIAAYPGLTILDGPECVVLSTQRDGDDRIGEVSVPFFGAEC